ncbi:MAG TPA: branched-chain amino acid ABC transporter substrate-binding protein [Solirubrobacterales bacterium]|nr:branched-chain amino acid ABC transporter substrate-binding protein [Solirubrobacterales bacterium]
MVAALMATSVVLFACGGDDDSDSSTTLAGVSAETCGDVIYDGEGDADALIVSDLPLQGDSEDRSKQMNDAIEEVLDDSEWTAGDTKIAFQACDDSLADTGLWDEKTCKDNATAYDGQAEVLGVIGTYNSGCAEAMIPILNKSALAMVSPGNTAICLTETASSCENGTPDSLYPSGDRNYARVVPNDAAQGAGLVTFAEKQGYGKVAVLYAADDPTSLGQAETFTNSAEPGGVKVTSNESWDPEAKDYTALMKKVGKTNPDAILLAGLTEQNGGRLIKDKVSVLGPNDGDVALMAPDGFAQQSTIDEAGSAARGMFASVPGRAPELLPGPGKELVDSISDEVDGAAVEVYAPYAGQAADVLLQAIAAGGTNRADITKALYGLQITDGITGSFEITETGDPSVSPITVNEASDVFSPKEVVEPTPALIKAARG